MNNMALNVGAKRRGRKPGLNSTVAQRSAANARERSRMRVLSGAFVELKGALPWVPKDTKLSKLDTLKLAAGYIAYLRRILDCASDSEESQTDFFDGHAGGSLSFLNPAIAASENSKTVTVSHQHFDLAHTSTEPDSVVRFTPTVPSNRLSYEELFSLSSEFYRSKEQLPYGEKLVPYVTTSSSVARNAQNGEREQAGDSANPNTDSQMITSIRQFSQHHPDNLEGFREHSKCDYTTFSPAARTNDCSALRPSEMRTAIGSHLSRLLTPTVRPLWDHNQNDFAPVETHTTQAFADMRFHKNTGTGYQNDEMNAERVLQTFGTNNAEPFFMRA